MSKKASISINEMQVRKDELSNPFKNMGMVESVFNLLPNADLILEKAGVSTDVYLEMIKDPQIIAVSQKRKRYIQSFNYKIEGDNPKVVEFLSEKVSNINITKLIDGLFLGVQVGYAVAELIWDTDDNGYWYIKEVKNRNPLRFKFDISGNLYYLDLRTYKKAPYGKFIIYSHEPTDDSNKYGNALNSSCFWYWSFKKKGWAYWLNVLQKYGLPPLVYKAVQDLETDEEDQEDINTKASLLSQVQSGASIVIDNNEDITALDIKADKDSFEKFIEIADKQIAKVYLGNPALIEEAKHGTYANAKIQEDGLKNIVIGDLKGFSNALRDYILEPLVRFNFGNNEKVPFFVFYKENENEVKEADGNLTDENNNQNNVTNESGENGGVEENTKIEEVENFAISEDLPEHTKALEKAINNLYNKQKRVYANIFEFKSLSNDKKLAIRQLKDFFFNNKQRLSTQISYALFYAMLLAKYEVKKQEESQKSGFSIKKLFEKFASDTKLYDGVFLPFDEARKKFKDKLPLSSEEFEKLKEEAKSGAFRIAGIESKKIVNVVKKALEDNFNNKKNWKQAVKDYLSSAGYDIKGNHLETIYRTNVFQSYAVAQWEQYQEVKDIFPALRYTAVMDGRTRPTHRALNGKVFKLEDPIWGRIYPPNGYNCRCTTIAVDMEEIKKVKVENGNSKEWKNFKVDDGFNHNPALSVREKVQVNYGESAGDKLNPSDYNLQGVTSFNLDDVIQKAIDEDKPVKKRFEINDILGNNVLIAENTTNKPDLAKNILQEPSEIWLKSIYNKNGTLSFKTAYIKQFEDNKGNTKKFIVNVDKYNQLMELKEVKNLASARVGGLLYFGDES